MAEDQDVGQKHEPHGDPEGGEASDAKTQEPPGHQQQERRAETCGQAQDQVEPEGHDLREDDGVVEHLEDRPRDVPGFAPHILHSLIGHDGAQEEGHEHQDPGEAGEDAGGHSSRSSPCGRPVHGPISGHGRPSHKLLRG